MCGEKHFFKRKFVPYVGSPPRVRGKAGRAKGICHATGITPACAGKSSFASISFFMVGDHPRVCGEKMISAAISSPVRGSPPRVRGKGITVLVLIVMLGITPACAGKRPILSFQLPPNKDHPRVCGEKRLKYPCAGPPGGSPPRVRGKDRVETFDIDKFRITPACAGKRQASLLRADLR